MSGNAKFMWFLLAPILVVLLVVVASPVISWAGKLEDAQEMVLVIIFYFQYGCFDCYNIFDKFIESIDATFNEPTSFKGQKWN